MALSWQQLVAKFPKDELMEQEQSGKSSDTKTKKEELKRLAPQALLRLDC